MFPPAQQQVQFGQRHDPPLAPSAPYLHGAAGLLNVPGTDQRIISALMIPVTGALANLPVVNGALGSGGVFGGEMAHYTSVFTGITSGDADTFTNQPTTDCADGPVGGLKKLCTYVNQYARFRFSTRELSMWRAGQRADFADQPMTVLNSPAMDAGIFAPQGMPNVQAAFSSEIADRMFETLVSSIRMLHSRIWSGSPANNSGERRDIMGFDLHINAGTHVDKDSSSVCTAADSDVKNFGYSLVTGNNRDIVQYIEMCDRFVMWRAQQQGLTPYVYDIYMRPSAWQVISEIWPVRQYQAFLAQMNLYTNGRMNVNASDAMDLRSQFQAGMVLPVNGRLIKVVLDEGIAEETPVTTPNLQPGQWASTIYGVPRTVMGAIPVTYLQLFNHANQQEEAIARYLGGTAGNGPTFTSDGGFIRWYTEFRNGCFKLNYEFSPRLHVLTPQIAWRIDHVAYAPLQHLTSADPASSYFADGGRTTGNTPQYYAPWSTTTRVTLS
jgi:hypothetical protein